MDVTVVIRVENARLERQLPDMMWPRIRGVAVEAVWEWTRVGYEWSEARKLAYHGSDALERQLTQDTLHVLRPHISECLSHAQQAGSLATTEKVPYRFRETAANFLVGKCSRNVPGVVLCDHLLGMQRPSQDITTPDVSITKVAPARFISHIAHQGDCLHSSPRLRQIPAEPRWH